MKTSISIIAYFLVSCIVLSAQAQQKSVPIPTTSLFNNNWQFVKDVDTAINKTYFIKNKTGVNWQNVSLPHTANIEPVIKVKQQWQGTCFYRKFFVLSKDDQGKHITVRLDAAMGEADVYLNGKQVLNHKGGFLPFEIDVNHDVNYSGENCLLVRLNNRDNPAIPPGKPIADLDFNFYGGIYRNAWLIKKSAVYITDAVTANKVNGGGVLLHFDSISAQKAVLKVKVEVMNNHIIAQKVRLKTLVYNPSGKLITMASTALLAAQAGETSVFEQSVAILHPALWWPVNPQLYKVVVVIENDRGLLDSVSIKTGIRQICFGADGFYLNGAKYVLRGTNRHQEYPYVGYALSDNAQYRDAYKIKQAGFDFVRCSHYPPSPAFLDACDQLGIFVMDSTPGWQFFGKEAFQQNSLQNIADMLHRDRNHPSVILWEASLNETDMPRDYMEKAHALVHQELPYRDTYTCGWMDAVYDVFIPARQHAKAPFYWKKYNKNKPIFIAEYGDWEYYAQNAGFNQTAYEGLTAEEKTSRQLRTNGDKRMMQQAINFQEAHNDNLSSSISGDANWLMFDYKRGYAPDIESSGIMDIFRLPKFAFYFYQSQSDVEHFKPMAFIASSWSSNATKQVTVYSNCQQVELFLNGKSLGRQTPDTGRICNNLKHPPFTFKVAYQPGTLTANGYINNKIAASAEQKTPERATKVKLTIDYSGKPLKAGCNDMVFVYASVVDRNGTVIPDAVNVVNLSVNGGVQEIAQPTTNAEAGIATFLVKAGIKKGPIKLTATSVGLAGDKLVVHAN